MLEQFPAFFLLSLVPSLEQLLLVLTNCPYFEKKKEKEKKGLIRRNLQSYRSGYIFCLVRQEGYYISVEYLPSWYL